MKSAPKPDPLFFSLQSLVVDLALINRHHRLAGQERAENDIEHSFTVTLLCWYIADTCVPDLNITRIMQYALAHDFVERYAGDVNTFADNATRQQKIVREKEAATRLSQEFAAFPAMTQAIQDYEEKQDPESLFVWTVDKMQALIMGDMDNWVPYQRLDITYEQFSEKYGTLLSQASPYCKHIFQALIDYCSTTYYDQPGNSAH